MMAAAMSVPAEYEDDVERIDRDYIPDDATSEKEIEAALRDAGFPEQSQSSLGDWLVSEEDAWSVVDGKTQDADSVRRALDRESGGTVSDGRAETMAENVASEIKSARAKAAQSVNANGQVQTESSGFGPKLQNAEEVVREDGLYYRATEGASSPGKEYKVASFDRGGSR